MDRPREKFRRMGDDALSHVELLAVIIGSGTAKFPVLTVCENLLKRAGGSLEKLAALEVEELCSINGIGETRALTFLASVALAKRLNKRSAETRVSELNDTGIDAFLQTVLAQAEGPQFLIVLSIDRRLLATVELAGDATLLPDISHVIRTAGDAGAAKFFLACNTSDANLDDHLKKGYCRKMKAAAGIMRLEFEGLILNDGTTVRRIDADENE